ncbi:diguanylate cyclase [Pseudomonas japonica]|uniref:diguanylate cyclase n=1 Tax=Pseudomonas japonica TaxID=256466 RepID=UPI0015E2DA2A|nr:diguanylate cyclase [Pseudomonas japonica]MBA1290563.1 GGDEF domain-containing protein [Pseudomonas japonica]
MPTRKPTLLIAAAAATLVMTITAAVGPFTLLWSNETRTERNLVENQLNSIREVQGLLVDAETGQRGYALTNNDLFLQRYYIAQARLPGALKTLELMYRPDTPGEIAKVNELIESANLTLEHLDGFVKRRHSSKPEVEDINTVATQGKALMDRVRALSTELIADEAVEVMVLDDELLVNLRWAVLISAISFIVTLGLGRFIYVSMRRAIYHERHSAEAVAVANAQLGESLVRLERRNKEISVLGGIARLLQTELSQEETLQVAQAHCQQLLGESSGTFYLYRNSADVLQQAASWGSVHTEEGKIMHPKECWAIRRGHSHKAEHTHDLRCAHYCEDTDASEATHWCVPLIAYGEVLGLLHINQPGVNQDTDKELAFAEAIAEQTALALANGRMREVLQTQSIKDPLTGLYNRRFMEATLDKELARARRTDTCLSVVMVDLDNFKALNDCHGHAAGDTVLRAVSSLLARSLRASDIACRFGGEELIVILPDCPPEGAAMRAEAIRASLEAMSVTEPGQSLNVTASFGVASTTLCGQDSHVLLKAADAALYKAKRAGKNRVESWHLTATEQRIVETLSLE